MGLVKIVRWEWIVKRQLYRRPRIVRLINLRVLTHQEACFILGVPLGATKRDIKAAYYEKAKMYHPDNQVRTFGASPKAAPK